MSAGAALSPDVVIDRGALGDCSSRVLSIGDAWAHTSLRFIGPQTEVVLEADPTTDTATGVWTLVDSGDDALSVLGAGRLSDGLTLLARADSAAVAVLVDASSVAFTRLCFDGDLIRLDLRSSRDGDRRDPVAQGLLREWVRERAALYPRTSDADLLVDQFAELLDTTSHLSREVQSLRRSLNGARKQNTALKAQQAAMMSSRAGRVILKLRGLRRRMLRWAGKRNAR